MKLSKQVCSLEQAKKLKELCVDQYQSAFYYYQQFVNGVESMPIYPLRHEENGGIIENESMARALDGVSNNAIYSAFTVAELGVMLPDGYNTNNEELNNIQVFTAWKHIPRGGIHALLNGGAYFNEAEARAAMLIYLLENNHITPFEVNQRLSND